LAFVDEIQVSGPTGCLARPLIVDATSGAVGCAIIEASFPTTACTCDATRGRQPAPDYVATLVRNKAKDSQLCNTATTPACTSACTCEIQQFAGADLTACQNDTTASTGVYGFCYIDTDQNIGNPAIVSMCPANQKRTLRFIGDNTPAADVAVFLGCPGAGL
jgi:hypothetical protein